MSPLFETVKIENMSLQNISFHNERMNSARKKLFGAEDLIAIEKAVPVPDELGNLIYKCRIIYDKKIRTVEITKYKRKNIKKLIAVKKNNIDYSYKYLNREVFDELLNKHANKPEEELLIIKKGLITDTSYTNVALLKDDKWYTPAEPLLKGTQRAKLISEGIIIEQNIKLKKLHLYSKVKLFNAMMEFDSAPELEVNSVMI